MSNIVELVLGCGFTGHKGDKKRVLAPGSSPFFQNPLRLDINPKCNPDITTDLDRLGTGLLPVPDNRVDEIHAYEVLEHLGRQGDFAHFFHEFHEYWRVLKPHGYFCATVPWFESLWAWGDPGHRRVINVGTLIFLSRREYEKQLGRTAMSDYRHYLGDTDFDVIMTQHIGDNFHFVLQAIKSTDVCHQ